MSSQLTKKEKLKKIMNDDEKQSNEGELNVMENIKISLNKFAESFKKHLALMIIFILLGSSLGLYAGKIIYNWRMGEITKVGGCVYNNKVYDVKLRP